MLRDKLMHHDPVDGFRWRSHDISRVEGFSDAVFGFAVTLLIVSLEVPRTSTELLATMRGFGAFVMTFLILAGMWYAQFTFFRRYGLQDRRTVALNLVLLFTVLFFVYPLKFLFGILLGGDVRMRGTVMTAHGLEPIVLPQHKPAIFAIFGAGFLAVFIVFFLLYQHAYAQREQLGLNEFELFETRHTIRRMKLSILVGVMYLVLAVAMMLPTGTEHEKQIEAGASLLIGVAFLVLMTMMLKMKRDRSRVQKEWIARSAGVAPPPDPGIDPALRD